MATFRYVLVTLCLYQIASSAQVKQNSGGNINGDNDEQPTTPRPVDPPIHHQFAAVGSRLSPKPVAEGPANPGAPDEGSPSEGTSIKKTEDTDDTDNEEESGAEGAAAEENLQLAESRRLQAGKKFPRQVVPDFQQAVNCGYIRLKPGQAVSLQSTNFNSGGTFRNFEQCTWKFFAQQCTIKANCPCFNLTTTPDCTGDYLKITDLYSFAHKFCGDSKPQGIYNSTTNNLKVHFRADGQVNEALDGFRCVVSCTGAGKDDPVALTRPTICS